MTTEWQYELLKLLLAGKTDLAFVHKTKFLPKSLFRYRTNSSTNLANLDSHSEWLSTPDQFNDVFDCCVTNVREDIYAGLRKSVDNGKFGDPDEMVKKLSAMFQIESVAEMMISSVNKKLRGQDVHIACFSERVNSTVMWAHYANQHGGYCLEYDFTTSPHGRQFFPVIYGQVPLSAVSNTTSESPASNQFPLLFKDQDWSYEREWRLIYYELFSINKGSQLLQMPMPTGIYMGMWADQSLKDRLIQVAEAKQIALYQMQPDFYKRELNAVKIL